MEGKWGCLFIDMIACTAKIELLETVPEDVYVGNDTSTIEIGNRRGETGGGYIRARMQAIDMDSPETTD